MFSSINPWVSKGLLQITEYFPMLNDWDTMCCSWESSARSHLSGAYGPGKGGGMVPQTTLLRCGENRATQPLLLSPLPLWPLLLSLQQLLSSKEQDGFLQILAIGLTSGKEPMGVCHRRACGRHQSEAPTTLIGGGTGWVLHSHVLTAENPICVCFSPYFTLRHSTWFTWFTCRPKNFRVFPGVYTFAEDLENFHVGKIWNF